MKKNYSNSVKAILVLAFVFVNAISSKAQVDHDFTESINEDFIVEFDVTPTVKPAWNEIYLKSESNPTPNIIWLHFGDGNIKYLPNVNGGALVESTFSYDVDVKINFKLDVDISTKTLTISAKNDGDADYTDILVDFDWSDVDGPIKGLQAITDNLVIENIVVTPKSGLSVSNNLIDSSFKLYPSRVDTKLNIESSLSIQSVNIFSLSGKLLKDINVANKGAISVDVSDINAGLYLLQVITDDNASVTKRFVKL